MGATDPTYDDGFVFGEAIAEVVLGNGEAVVVVVVVVVVVDQNARGDVLLGRLSVLAVEPAAVLLRSICTVWCKSFEWSSSLLEAAASTTWTRVGCP